MSRSSRSSTGGSSVGKLSPSGFARPSLRCFSETLYQPLTVSWTRRTPFRTSRRRRPARSPRFTQLSPSVKLSRSPRTRLLAVYARLDTHTRSDTSHYTLQLGPHPPSARYAPPVPHLRLRSRCDPPSVRTRLCGPRRRTPPPLASSATRRARRIRTRRETGIRTGRPGGRVGGRARGRV